MSTEAMRDDSLETYIAIWNDVKAMIASKAFSRSYVLGVIAASRSLTDGQKIKMRDASLQLLGD